MKDSFIYYWKGRKQSPEHRRHRSEALLGHKLSQETKEKIRQKALGRKAWNKGLRKSSSPEKIKYGMSLEKHWNWKGGISRPNTLERQQSRYKEWRDKVFRRDGFTCRRCHRKGVELNAHHKKSFASFPKLRYVIGNGITLCTKCHLIIHKKQKYVSNKTV